MVDYILGARDHARDHANDPYPSRAQLAKEARLDYLEQSARRTAHDLTVALGEAAEAISRIRDEAETGAPVRGETWDSLIEVLRGLLPPDADPELQELCADRAEDAYNDELG